MASCVLGRVLLEARGGDQGSEDPQCTAALKPPVWTRFPRERPTRSEDAHVEGETAKPAVKGQGLRREGDGSAALSKTRRGFEKRWPLRDMVTARLGESREPVMGNLSRGH